MVGTSRTILTIGHSTHPPDEFIRILHSFEIAILTDIRSFPVSKRNPWFNKEVLQKSLSAEGINYIHLPELGGRREGISYSEYMLCDKFKEGIILLENLAVNFRLAYMCAEADWRRCHRSLVSNYLMERGWQVIHILNEGISQEHHSASKQEKLF